MLTKAEREALIRDHVPYAHRLADQIRRRVLPWIPRDDLLSAAHEGLVVAAQRYDPARGAAFSTFAYYRIRGSVMDHARQSSESMSAGAARLRALAAVDDMVEITVGSVAPTVDRSDADAAETLSQVLAEAAQAFAIAESVSVAVTGTAHASPEERAIQYEAVAWLEASVTALPDRERQMIDAVYRRGLTIEQAGGELGVTKGWASRLHAKALRLLRKAAKRKGVP